MNDTATSSFNRFNENIALNLQRVGAGLRGGVGITRAGYGLRQGSSLGGTEKFYNLRNDSLVAASPYHIALSEPVLRVINDELTGLPDSLMGTSGACGCGFVTNGSPRRVVGRGGDGGAGGAGLVVLAPGFNNGDSGTVDASGDDGQPGEIISWNSRNAHSGSGGGGHAGGVLLVSFDGTQFTEPASDGNFILNNGVSPYIGEFIAHGEKGVSGGTYSQLPGYAETLESVHIDFVKIAYLNLATALEDDLPEYVETPPSFTLTEYTNTPVTPDGDISTIEVAVTPPADNNYVYSLVDWRVQGQTAWNEADPASHESLIEVTSNGAVIEVRVRPVARSTRLATPTGEIKTITVTDKNGRTDVELAVIYPFDPITGLGIDQGGTVFTGLDAVFQWDNDNSEKAWFNYYEVQIYSGATLLRTEKSVSPFYVYDYVKNSQDYLAQNSTQGVTNAIEIRVRPVSKYYNSTPSLYAGAQVPFTATSSTTNDPENLRFYQSHNQQMIDDIATALAGSGGGNGITTFYQAGTPSSAETGDLWFDTDDDNKIYRYDGTSWESADDDRIALAVNNAQTAQTTADGKAYVFNQESTPTTPTPTVGDLWYRPSTKELSRHNGSGWDVIGNAFANTSDLTDDAGLGDSALWGQVGNRPSNLAALTGAEAINNALITPASIGAETPAGSQAAADAAQAAAEAYADATFVLVTTHTLAIADLQSQIDGNITSHFYSGVPTTANSPANAWTTNAERDNHLGDLYYDTATGYAYRYQKISSVYSWQQLSDSDIAAALAAASAAQDTADNKRRVFIVTPSGPYDAGDLWDNGSVVRRSTVNRASGYVAGDWTEIANYTINTSDLTDDANLGGTADWPNVSNRPSDDVLLNNLIDLAGWTIGGPNPPAGWTLNGSAAENQFVSVPGPYGFDEVVWEAKNEGTDNGADGGFHTPVIASQPDKPYRFACWIKQVDSTEGAAYFGFHGSTSVVNIGTGATTGNPYFWSGDLPELDKWYLAVGYVLPHNTAQAANSGRSGVYDPETGQQVRSGTDFKWQSSNNGMQLRGYQYYNTTADPDRVYFARPRIDLADGSEPSVAALLHGDASLLPNLNNSNQQWDDIQGAPVTQITINTYDGSEDASQYSAAHKSPVTIMEITGTTHSWPTNYGGVITHWFEDQRAKQVVYDAGGGANEEWIRFVNPSAYPTWSAWKRQEVYSSSDVDALQTQNAPAEAGATAGADWDNDVANIPGRFSDTATQGLNVTDTHMGFYDTTDGWQTYINNAGHLFLIGDSDNYINWDGSTLEIKGTLQARDIKTSDSGQRIEIRSSDNQIHGLWDDGSGSGNRELMTLGNASDGSGAWAAVFGDNDYIDNGLVAKTDMDIEGLIGLGGQSWIGTLGNGKRYGVYGRSDNGAAIHADGSRSIITNASRAIFVLIPKADVGLGTADTGKTIKLTGNASYLGLAGGNYTNFMGFGTISDLGEPYVNPTIGVLAHTENLPASQFDAPDNLRYGYTGPSYASLQLNYYLGVVITDGPVRVLIDTQGGYTTQRGAQIYSSGDVKPGTCRQSTNTSHAARSMGKIIEALVLPANSEALVWCYASFGA